MDRIIVVGSGIGGMAAAALFSKAGYRVTVLEANEDYIGGHGRCLRVGNMRFSMGPQYVWEFGNGQTGKRFLEYLGIHDLCPFLPMEEDGFERLFVGDRKEGENWYFMDFSVPMGLDRFGESLKRMFPEEAGSIDSLFNDMIAVYDVYKAFFRKNAINESRLLNTTRFLLTGKISSAMKVRLGRTIYMSVKELFDRHGISPAARRILYGHGGIFAESESDMSAVAYIVGTGNYHAGAWYPEKGFHHFFRSLAGVVEAAGGSVHRGKRVVRLETFSNRVSRAVCADGSSYESDFVFSDVSPRLTYALLDDLEESFDYSPSHAVGACCIGITGGLPAVREMRGKNYWWQDGVEVEYHVPDVTRPPRMLFINSPTANGFGGEPETPDDSLVVFFPGNYSQEMALYRQGPDAFWAFKRQLSDHITGILDRNVFPGIAGRVAFSEIVSAVDTQSQILAERAAAYGRRLSVDEILKGEIREKRRPENLRNVSAAANSPGIAAGIYTAKLLFNDLAKKDF